MSIKSIPMDVRKVVKFINESAQSEINLMRKIVKDMGKKVGKQYDLVALRRDKVLFEDVDSNEYYLANHSNEKGKTTINRISRINIEESKKEHVFKNACVELVEAISEGKDKEADIAFKKIESCRYRPTVADSNGYVTTKDGVHRRMYCTEDCGSIDTDTIAETAVKYIKNDVIMEGNDIICATFGDGKFELPIDKTFEKREIARQMRAVAEGAYKSNKFQAISKHLAALVSKDKIREAIVESAKFMREFQEFCMLDLGRMNVLVEKALACQNVYNPSLIADTALLMYRSNIKVNKKEILEAWEKAAKDIANPVLLENVTILSESEKFEKDYDKFLAAVVLENSEANEAYGAVLDMAKSVLKKKREDIATGEESADENTEEVVNTVAGALEGGEGDDVDAEFDAVELEEGIIHESMSVDEIDRVINQIEKAQEEAEAGDYRAQEDLAKGIATRVKDLNSFDDVEDEELDADEIADNMPEDFGDVEEGEGEGEEGGGGLGGLDLGGEGGEDFDLGGGEGGEDFDLGGEEGEEGEEDLGEEDIFDSKDVYDDFVIAEDEEIDLGYGVRAINENEDTKPDFLKDKTDKKDESSEDESDSDNEDDKPDFLKDKEVTESVYFIASDEHESPDFMSAVSQVFGDISDVPEAEVPNEIMPTQMVEPDVLGIAGSPEGGADMINPDGEPPVGAELDSEVAPEPETVEPEMDEADAVIGAAEDVDGEYEEDEDEVYEESIETKPKKVGVDGGAKSAPGAAKDKKETPQGKSVENKSGVKNKGGKIGNEATDDDCKEEKASIEEGKKPKFGLGPFKKL